MSQIISAVIIEATTKSTLFTDTLISINKDRRKERTLMQRFVHRKQTLNDKIYISFSDYANFLLSQLSLRLTLLNGVNGQQFTDIRQRTYLSGKAEMSVFHLIAYADIFDFLVTTQNLEGREKLLEIIDNALSKAGVDIVKNADIQAADCSNLTEIGKNPRRCCDDPITTEFELKVFMRITREIFRIMAVINTEKRSAEQWNLVNELAGMGFKCAGIIQEFHQNSLQREHINKNKHNKEDQVETSSLF